ncbi:MAG TPA: HNH endonuclease [Gemmatimonadaceae bacterium]|nr:HNH endonuclease [Gemmatimonadaceae bacterium]
MPRPRPLHGLTPSLAIVDELHAHPNDQVYLAVLTALAKRRGSKLLVISSAGQGADTPLGRLRTRALAKPATDVDHILPVIQVGTDHPDNLRAGCAHCNRSRRPRSSSLR